MKRAPRRTPLPSERSVQAVRDLLQHLRDPHWLRRSEFVAAYLSDAVDAQADDFSIVQGARDVVLRALAELPVRARTIVERTALNGETCRRAAHELGISERQLHRDRLLAISLLARAFTARRNGKPASSDAVVVNVGELRVSQALGLGELGHFDEADALLQDVARASESRTMRSRILGHLVRLCAEQGRVREGKGYAAAAIDAASDGDDPVALADAAIAQARIDVLDGRVASGEASLRASVIALRPLVMASDAPAAKESLVQGLVGQWEVFRIAGRAHEAHTAATQAVAYVRELDRPALALKLAAGAAHADAAMFLWDSPGAAEAELNAYYSAAVAGGSIRSALHFATLLGLLEHFKGKLSESAARLNELLPLALSLNACTTKTYFLIALGIALTYAGHKKEAVDVLLGATEHAPKEHRRLLGYLSLARSTTQMRAGDAGAALAASQDAIDMLSAPLDMSLLGTCVYKKAQSLVALGRLTDALDAAEEARSLLEASGHPINLDDTRHMIARLKGRLHSQRA